MLEENSLDPTMKGDLRSTDLEQRASVLEDNVLQFVRGLSLLSSILQILINDFVCL